MASIRPMWRGSSVVWTRSPQRRRIQSSLQMPLIAASRPERGLAWTAPPRWRRSSVRSSFEIVLRFGFIVLFVAFGTEFSKRLARIIERPHGVRLLVASPPVADLLFFAKHLFVAAIVAIAAAGGSRMSNGTASALNSEQGLASIPMAEGVLAAWLSRASKAPACRWRPFLSAWA
jgi:hypothetical protein